MPKTAAHLKEWQFHNIPPERQLELARMGGHASRGFASRKIQRKASRMGVRARRSTKLMTLLVKAFTKIEKQYGRRKAVIAVWRLGKRSAYDAKYHKQRKDTADKSSALANIEQITRLVAGLGELRRVISQIGVINSEIYPETVVITHFIDNLVKSE